MQIEVIIIRIAALVFAVTIHEVAHGWMAYRLGDPTAKLMGRLSLNPIRHLDPMGSIIVPGFLVLTGSSFLIGWAKPVPVNFGNLKGPKDAILVSVAGVAANLACALGAGLLFQGLWEIIPRFNETPVFPVINGVLLFLLSFVVINAVLAVFNLIPIPPLDGGRILTFALPPELGQKFEQVQRYGMLILIVLLVTGVLEKILTVCMSPILKICLGDAVFRLLG